MNTIETNNCSTYFKEEQQSSDNEDQKLSTYTPTNTHNANPDTNINTIWTKDSFNNKKIAKHELNLNAVQGNTMGWRNQLNNLEEADEAVQQEDEELGDKFLEKSVVTPTSPAVENEANSPSHHARRPMNAFLIFCKKHRPIVRKKFPNLENRGVTRILGEWWAMLDNNDKEPYKNLAKEYKDAFFSANPGFKWYKLPAPPLRTLVTRPGSVQKEPLLPQSPTLASNQHESEFTPGKLADESQLGNLTSLMQSSFNKPSETDTVPAEKTKTNSADNNNCAEDHLSVPTKHEILESPPNVIREPTVDVPLKPIKKRKVIDEYVTDNKSIARNIFETPKISDDNISNDDEDRVNHDKISNRELMDKVVENMFHINQNYVPHQENGISKNNVNINDSNSNNTSKEPRKSERSCKGLKYIEFMANGKLLKNKREKQVPSPGTPEVTNNKKEEEKLEKVEKLDLQQTIRRLAERTNKIIPDFPEIKERERPRTHTHSESSSEENFSKSEFNLEDRIAGLPTLNYDVYMQRKRESKKRKMPKTKHLGEPKHKVQIMASNINNNNILIGSQKRKNKQSITHLELNDSQANNNNNFVPNDLLGLTTLAEIAANSQKIN